MTHLSTPTTAQQLSERIKDQLAAEGVLWQPSHSDGFTLGDPSTIATGVAVTFKPTMHVLREAAERGLNIVISHEAAFWDGFDAPQFMADDPIRHAKTAFVHAHDMAVWRLHDHMHRMAPEPIFTELIEKVGWSSFFTADQGLHHLKIPELRLDELAAHLQSTLETRNISVVGDPAMLVRSVGFGIHVLSTLLPALRLSDVVIVGETAEYDAYEYMRDAVALGQPKGLIRIAHERLEEWGVARFADWMRPLAKGLPVEWISTGDPFNVPLRPQRPL